MDRLLKHIQRVRPAAFCSPNFFLLHNNASAHKAASVCQFLTPKKCYNLLYPPYSPDLSPPDYFLFPKLKMKLKGFHFADVVEIQEAVTNELRISKRWIFGKSSETVRPRKSQVCVFDLKKKSVLKLFERNVYNTDRMRVTGESRSTEGKFISVSPFPQKHLTRTALRLNFALSADRPATNHLFHGTALLLRLLLLPQWSHVTGPFQC